MLLVCWCNVALMLFREWTEKRIRKRIRTNVKVKLLDLICFIGEVQQPPFFSVLGNKIVMVDLVFELKRMLVDPKVFPVARDNAIDTILKNLMHMDCGLPRGWSWRFVENDGEKY